MPRPPAALGRRGPSFGAACRPPRRAGPRPRRPWAPGRRTTRRGPRPGPRPRQPPAPSPSPETCPAQLQGGAPGYRAIAMSSADLVIVSNRGPLSFAFDDTGEPKPVRGAGGLVTTLGPAVRGTGATWVAAAISDADREAAGAEITEAEGFRLRSLVVDQEAFRQFYDVIANSTLWYLHHGLWDRVRRPRFDRRWREAWVGYREVNHAFADAVAEEAPAGATVLVHDYQLSLVPARLVKQRPDLAVVYFHHTPFCSPTELRAIPADAARELLEGVVAARACGFHSPRWAEAFEACVDEVLGEPVRTFVAPAV